MINSHFLNHAIHGLSRFTGQLSWVSSAYAQDAAGAQSPGQGMLLQMPIFVALFGLFYFGMIRPQRNQQKKHVEFLTKLSRGEEVVTASGIIGKIVGLNERVVTLDVSEGTEIKILRTQVQSYLKDSLPGAHA